MTRTAPPTTTPSAYAFFDVDDTLIAVKSMFSFQDYWYGRGREPGQRQAFEMDMDRLRNENAPWEELNSRYYSHFKGRDAAEVAKLGAEWFSVMERNRPKLYHTKVVERLRQLQAEGVEPVFVSGSFPALLAPVAERLQVRHLLCCRPEIEAGLYTGRLLPPQTIGTGKAVALLDFLKEHDVLPSVCHAFGDDITDRPMLEAVGHPVVVAGGRALEVYAASVGWPVIQPR